MAYLTDRPTTPSPARLSDRRSPRTAEIIIAICAILFVGGFVFATWWLPRQHQYLQSAVSLPSPDGKTRFEADRNGALRFVDVRTGRLLHKQQLSPNSYSEIKAKWTDNRSVQFTAPLRYGALVSAYTYIWNSKSGSITTPYDTSVTQIRNP